MLLALSLMVSMLAIGAVATDDANPTITSAVAINDTQFKITTSEPVTVKNTGTFALFLAKNGVVDNLNERSNAQYKETGTRYGGTMSPANTATTEFTWTINTGVNATDAIENAIAAGYEVYFGLNGNASTGMIDVSRAVDSEGKGFVPNLDDNHATHGIYGVKVDAYKPNTITSVKLINNTQIEIEFAAPVTACTDSLFLCLLDKNGVIQNSDADSDLDNHTSMDFEITDGKLVCELRSDHPGMSEDGKNITKFIALAEAKYPNYVAGIAFLEPTNAEINNSGLMENITDANDIPLKATGLWGATTRDTCTAVISAGVAKVNGTPYFTLDEAMQNATAGDEIDLLDDVTVADKVFVLDADVTLDLNGNELAVNNVMTFGDIIDSTEGTGKLVPAQNARVILNTENLAMPLYDTNGYRFFTYTLASAGPKNGTTDSVQFGVQLTFANTDAYALLAKDVTTTIKLALAVTKDDKVTNLTFIFKQGTLEQYKDAWNNRTDLTKTPTLVLTVSGIEGVDSISCTPSISQSATTVIRTGSALFYSPIA